MSDKESQADEVEALQSIFSEEEFSSSNENGIFCLQFYAFINLPEDFKIVFRDLNEPGNDVVNEQTIKVHYLPPIEMYLKLPHNYPSVSPPLFQLCCSWLSYDMLTKLCKELDRLWTENEGSEILFIWTQFLKEECLNFLEITDRLDISEHYSKELVYVKNIKFIQGSSRNNPITNEQDKNVECLNNSNSMGNCDIQNRLLLDSVVSSNVVEKSDIDSLCSSEKSVQETMTGCDSYKNTNFMSHVTNRRQFAHHYNDKKHNDHFRNSESEHTNDVSKNRRRQRNEKRRSNYDKKKENESSDNIVEGDNYDRKKVPFEKKRSNVIPKSYNADTHKWETMTDVSSPSNQIWNSHDTRKTVNDKSRRFRNDDFATERSNSSGRNDVSSDSKTYSTFEYVNSKYRRYMPRRYGRYASKSESKTATEVRASKSESKRATEVCKENKEREKTVIENDSCNVNKYNRSNFSNENCANTSLAVNNVNSPLSNTEVSSSCCQPSNDTLSLSLSRLSVNNSKTCTSAESVHTLNVNSKTLHGQKRVYDRRIRKPKQHKNHLHEVIEDYNRERSKTEFGRNIFTCNICFANKLGIMCTQFKPCEHVFCRDCISSYMEVCIKEGKVQSINCPEHKCNSEASPPQIRELVSPELFAKYDHLLLSTMLDTMGDIIYCPRPSCQYPVSKEENEKMAMCPECNYVFCIYCKMVYHGVEPCRLKNEEKLSLIKEYQSANRETKLKLEQRYGKSLLISLVENHMSEAWIHNNSNPCPSCNTAIEKSDGCNKMVCWKCNTFFCWLCGARLDPLAPYKHYYDTKSRCNNRLFEGIIIDGNDSDNEENMQFDNDEPEAVPFEMGYNMFVINLNLDPELENRLLVRIDNVD